LQGEPGNFTAKIGDFGMVYKKGGTPIYMAPEGLANRELEKTDIYSLGITMLLFLFERSLALRLLYHPYKADIRRSVLNSRWALKLIFGMISVDTSERLTIAKVSSLISKKKYNGNKITDEDLHKAGEKIDDLSFENIHIDNIQSQLGKSG
jgi:serine/threonine protein kinase